MAGAMALGLVPRILSLAQAVTFVTVFQCSFRFNSYIGLTAACRCLAMPGSRSWA